MLRAAKKRKQFGTGRNGIEEQDMTKQEEELFDTLFPEGSEQPDGGSHEPPQHQTPKPLPAQMDGGSVSSGDTRVSVCPKTGRSFCADYSDRGFCFSGGRH